MNWKTFLSNWKFLAIGTAIATIFIILLLVITIDVVTVEGYQMGVKETWSGGVEEEPHYPKTYFLFPAWSQKIYTYDMSTQVFIMNDLPTAVETVAQGRDTDSYKVQSSEGQDMWISLNVRWRINPEKIVQLHKLVRMNIEEKLIRPTVQLVVKNQATKRTAIEAYSGEGLVKLQADILTDLTATSGELYDHGIIVENFVIEGIRLDERYIGEIKARQVATQRKLRADEETKAAQAEAIKAQAEARADYNRRVVEAERDKQVGVLKAEEEAQKKVLAAKADAEQVTLAAEASKKQVVLSAEGEKEAGELRAQAIKSIGQAEADALKLKMNAYGGEGAEVFAKIETAKALSQGYSGIKGYLPENMKVNLLTESFLKSVEQLMKPQPQK